MLMKFIYHNIVNLISTIKNFERRKSIHVLLEILNKKKIREKISYVQKVNFSKIFDRLSNLSNIYNLKNNIYCLRLSRLGKEKLKKQKKFN